MYTPTLGRTWNGWRWLWFLLLFPPSSSSAASVLSPLCTFLFLPLCLPAYKNINIYGTPAHIDQPAQLDRVILSGLCPFAQHISRLLTLHALSPCLFLDATNPPIAIDHTTDTFPVRRCGRRITTSGLSSTTASWRSPPSPTRRALLAKKTGASEPR